MRFRRLRLVTPALVVLVGASRAESPIDVDVQPTGVTLSAQLGPVVDVRVVVRQGALGAGRLVPPVLESTAGHIEGLSDVGGGTYVAKLVAPDERFPQLAVVTALDTRPVAAGAPPEVASAVVSYSAAIDLRGHTEPHASMLVRIAGKTFGPVSSQATGAFTLPVEVPPGARFGAAVSTDELGNASRSKIDLFLPEVARVHASVYPTRVVVGGEDSAWIFVTTVGADGAPRDQGIELRARAGTVGAPVRLGLGLYRATYRAPTALGEGRDTVEIRCRKERQRVDVAVGLLAEAPTTLVFEPADAQAPADGRTPLRAEVTARDRFGNPAAGHALTLVVQGTEHVADEVAAGRYVVQLDARDRVAREAGEWRLTPQTTLCPRPRIATGGAQQRIVDRRGIPCVVAFVRLDGGEHEVERGMTDATGQLGLVASAGQENGNSSWLRLANTEPSCTPPVTASSTAARTVAPLRAALDLRWNVVPPVRIEISEIGRSAGRLLLRIALRGEAMRVERLRIEATSGAVQVIHQTVQELDVAVPYRGAPVQVAVTDLPTGVSGWLEAE
ncbi:MAG: hypothetical protein AAB426_10355 [Myxococcota bacterium]